MTPPLLHWSPLCGVPGGRNEWRHFILNDGITVKYLFGNVISCGIGRAVRLCGRAPGNRCGNPHRSRPRSARNSATPQHTTHNAPVQVNRGLCRSTLFTLHGEVAVARSLFARLPHTVTSDVSRLLAGGLRVRDVIAENNSNYAEINV